jgi:ribonuclease T2
MPTRLLAIALMLLMAPMAALPVAAQYSAPWPSERFNPKPRAHVAGEFDYYTLVLSWSPTHCVTAESGRDDEQCARSDGLRYGFVLHGLWPQYENGYPEACRIGRRPYVPDNVINSMLDVMPSRGLVIHEYRRHGTCSGLDPQKYYMLSRALYKRVSIPARFNNPFEPQFVSPGEVVREFVRANPGLQPDMMAVTCAGPGNRLRDVRICLTRDGRPRRCTGNEQQNKLCRADRMHVPPVRSTRRDDKATGSNPMKPPRDRGLPRPKVIEFDRN